MHACLFEFVSSMLSILAVNVVAVVCSIANRNNLPYFVSFRLPFKNKMPGKIYSVCTFFGLHVIAREKQKKTHAKSKQGRVIEEWKREV